MQPLHHNNEKFANRPGFICWTPHPLFWVKIKDFPLYCQFCLIDSLPSIRLPKRTVSLHLSLWRICIFLSFSGPNGKEMLPFLEVLPDDSWHLWNLLNLLSSRLIHCGSPLLEHMSGLGSRCKVRAGGAPPEGTDGMLVIVMGGCTCWAEAHEL